MRPPAELTEAFRQQGLKITPQRVAVFRALHGEVGHPTAESVYLRVRSEIPSISLRTVYQTLNDLAGMGEVQSLDLGTGSARFDPNTAEHHHLVCERCGVVRDVYLPLGDLAPSDEQLQGFLVKAVEVVFRGRCATCSPFPPHPHTGGPTTDG